MLGCEIEKQLAGFRVGWTGHIEPLVCLAVRSCRCYCLRTPMQPPGSQLCGPYLKWPVNAGGGSIRCFSVCVWSVWPVWSFPSEGSIQLDCLGGIQDKITVCATDDSYQKARQSMAQAEEETRSRGAIVIKPGGRYVGKAFRFGIVWTHTQKGTFTRVFMFWKWQTWYELWHTLLGHIWKTHIWSKATKS